MFACHASSQSVCVCVSARSPLWCREATFSAPPGAQEWYPPPAVAPRPPPAFQPLPHCPLPRPHSLTLHLSHCLCHRLRTRPGPESHPPLPRPRLRPERCRPRSDRSLHPLRLQQTKKAHNQHCEQAQHWLVCARRAKGAAWLTCACVFGILVWPACLQAALQPLLVVSAPVLAVSAAFVCLPIATFSSRRGTNSWTRVLLGSSARTALAATGTS